jgi:acetolactate synthase-1/2/3 large subunit
MATRTGNQLIAETLRQRGVTHFFYVPVLLPYTMMDMTTLGLCPVVTHSEKAAVYMADGFARIARRPGVCGAQHIGASNLAAGLREPLMANSPVIAFAGGPAPETRYLGQYQDVEDMPTFTSLTKWSGVIENPARIADMMSTAWRIATSGTPGPVHLQVKNFWGSMASGEVDQEPLVDPRYTSYPAVRTRPIEADLTAAAKLIDQAERPIIIAGTGSIVSGAQSNIETLAKRAGIPIVVSTGAKALLPVDHDFLIGVSGDYSQESSNMAVNDADLVIFIGSRTSSNVTRNWTVPGPDKNVIQIDIDPHHIGRNYPKTLPLVGDADITVAALNEHVSANGRDAWLSKVRAYRSEFIEYAVPLETSGDIPMRPERLCAMIGEVLPNNAILVCDTGHAPGWMARHIPITSRDQSVIRAAGSLGWSFPAAIGAKAAAPDRPVVCFTGDGGVHYHLTEIETALRYNLPTVTVINNNVSLNQEMFIWKDRPDCDRNWRFEDIDFAKVAEGLGGWGRRVDNPADFKKVFAEALASGKPAVIDARTDDKVIVPLSWGPGATLAYGMGR